MKISISLFTDDMENALRQQYPGTKWDLMDSSQLEEIRAVIDTYLNSHLTIDINGKLVNYQFLGIENDRDVVWVYVEIEKVRKWDRIMIRNTLLMDIFQDQENLIHVRKDGIVKSARLSYNKTQATLVWE